MKKLSVFIIKISISGILLYLILRKVDIYKLQSSFMQGHLVQIFKGVLVGITFNLVKFIKWHKLINAGNTDHTYWDGAKSYMIGNALGVVTPMRAGDLGRSLYFPLEIRPRIIGFTIVDRLLDLIAVLIFSVGGSFILINTGFGIMLAVLSIIGLLTLYSPRRLYRISKKFISSGSKGNKLSRVMEVLKLLDVRILTISLLLSFIAFFLIILQFYYVISAFENTTFITACLATPLVTLSALIPITFMGLGVREGLSIYLFSMLGITSTTAFTTAFLCFVINNISTSIIGIIYLWSIGISRRQASHRTY